jgi:hypothetical protein
MGEDGDETNLPLLYLRPGDIEAIESVLWQLNECPVPHMNAGRDSFRACSACKVFHELRNASMDIVNAVILAEHELINGALEFTEGISCDFHEELEAMRYCSLSGVQSWSFLIMDECCGPLPTEIIPGKHCDLSTYLTKTARAAYLNSRIRCWNPNYKFQQTTLMQNNATSESGRRCPATVASAPASSPQTQRPY